MVSFAKGFVQFMVLCFCSILVSALAGNASADGPVDLSGNLLGNRGFDDQDQLSHIILLNTGNRNGPGQVVSQSLQNAPVSLFTAYQAFPVGSWPEAVAIGDVNNDGRNDVVLTTSKYFDPDNDNHIFVFLQTPEGTLSGPVKYPAGNGESIDIADLNNDGKNDVVVTTSNAIGVFLQRQDGSLNPMISYPSNHSNPTNTYKVRTGDFNHDGLTDVVSIDWGSRSDDVDIYVQNDTGTLNPPVTYRVLHAGYDDLEVGDVNDDGLTDIIVMSGQSYAYDNIGILIQTSEGLFDTPVYYDIGLNANTRGVAVGDVNNDSLEDIVVTYGGNKPSSFISVFQQSNTQTLGPPVPYSSYDIPESVEIADVNQDGQNDVIVLHGGWMKMGVYLQKPDGALDTELLFPIPYASHYNPHGLAVGDLNADGSPDIAIADYNNGLVLLYNASVVAEPPVADAGPDLIEYDYVTLDASRSYDPDGDIVSFDWKISRMDNPADMQTANGKIVYLNALRQGFYDVNLTVTDDEGLVGQDNILLAVKGREPQCKYTEEDVNAAYASGYSDGKSQNEAWYDVISGKLLIPAVRVNGNTLSWEMLRNGKSHNFMLKEGFESIRQKRKP